MPRCSKVAGRGELDFQPIAGTQEAPVQPGQREQFRREIRGRLQWLGTDPLKCGDSQGRWRRVNDARRGELVDRRRAALDPAPGSQVNFTRQGGDLDSPLRREAQQSA
jgi:hypothetical protein